MNYCSHCGSDHFKRKIPADDQVKRIVCENCGTIHYENPRTIVGCLILNDKNEIMLCRRGIEPQLGLWNLPAGFLENDEAVDSGALREVFEETRAEVEIIKLHSIYNLLKAQQVYLFFRAKMLKDHYELTPESTEIQFFPADQIPWKEIAFSSNVHALEHWINIQNGASDELSIGTLKLH
ncbi:NUDIX hydrolase [Croceimicrobium hydrocarbonivorans]|uniref:NUDIX hydrolase n=1 Tax=Croceimicrobium hydrocarbonivorans TaxID=2761580 RepID=A0A7H0VDY6_9FLAO|nr:NUDIX hydrolase [Croceimicrobium hydrocarbonivorans]QNR23934.1 NUDIX hydrolase [Croceimicrobium hydrocarbonivorans]